MLQAIAKHLGVTLAYLAFGERFTVPQSRILDQAENRLHAQKALMAWLMGGYELPAA